MDSIDDNSGWTAEGLGIAIRMRDGDLARRPRTPFYLRWVAVLLSVMTLAILMGVAGWFAWRSLARGEEEEAAQPDSIARG